MASATATPATGIRLAVTHSSPALMQPLSNMFLSSLCVGERFAQPSANCDTIIPVA